MVAPQPLLLEAERAVEADRRLVVGEDLELDLVDVRRAGLRARPPSASGRRRARATRAGPTSRARARPSRRVGCSPSDADELGAVLEHEEEVAVPFDRGAEPLLEVLDRRSSTRSPASALRRRRPSSRGRSRSQSSIVAGRTSIAREDTLAAGQSSRRARIAKAWDQASGVVERGTPVRGVDALGQESGGRRRAAQVRQQAQRRGGARRVPPGSRRVQAVGAVQGSSPPPSPRRGRCRSARSRQRGGSSVRRTAGKSAGCGKGRTAQAAAESSPESGSPAPAPGPAASRTAPACRVSAPEAIALAR